MVKNRKLILIGFIVLLVATGIYFTIKKSENKAPADNAIVEGINLYYTNSCPHCKNVQDFINASGIRQKIAFKEKEISSNELYSQEMTALAGQCGLESNQVGVPFLWDGKKCLIGDKNIISFFQDRSKNE